MIEFESQPSGRPAWLIPVIAALLMGLAAGSLVNTRRNRSQAPSTPPAQAVAQTSAVPVTPAPPPAPKPEPGVVSTVVLCYHRIADKPDQQTVLPPARFAEQMKYLADNGYTVLPLQDVVKALAEGTALPLKSVVITFDDGFLTDYKAAFPVLQQYKFPATVFVYSGWVGKAAGAVKWEQLQEMQQSGLVDVESHTVSHADLVKTAKKGAERLKKELADSKAEIEAKLGKPCTIIAYPYGASNDEVRAATKAAGYEAGLTVDGGPVASGDNLFKLGRRMVFRKDALEAFATQRVAPRKLVLSQQTPEPGKAQAERPASASAQVPAGIDAAKLSMTLDGKPLEHAYDEASRTVSATLPDSLAGRHRVGVQVADGPLKLKSDWLVVAPGEAGGNKSGGSKSSSKGH